jgi:hypothetical protein
MECKHAVKEFLDLWGLLGDGTKMFIPSRHLVEADLCYTLAEAREAVKLWMKNQL